MSTARLRELQASLRRELSRQTQGHCQGPAARVVWLVGQLEHYVKRWVGLRPASSPAAPSLNEDLFLMIAVGAEAVSEEVRALESPAIAESWRSFLAVLTAVRGGCTTSVEELSTTLAIVRSSLEP